MTDNGNRICGESPPGATTVAWRQRWPRSAKVSLVSGILGAIFVLLAFVSICISIEPAAVIGFSFHRAGEILIAISGIAAAAFLSVSLVSGLAALRRTRVVLWWVVPLLLLALIVISSGLAP
ncbi:MAG: hypothetical protein BWY59_00772 [Verrucomicrobia bacterium ADurb.Bin345]|nr:MAG: hypothetical protein BWY59_00772 [Verrucomicrobia bacterium ADurb.Bin345]